MVKAKRRLKRTNADKATRVRKQTGKSLNMFIRWSHVKALKRSCRSRVRHKLSQKQKRQDAYIMRRKANERPIKKATNKISKQSRKGCEMGCERIQTLSQIK